jgi:hypothetical protein
VRTEKERKLTRKGERERERKRKRETETERRGGEEREVAKDRGMEGARVM